MRPLPLLLAAALGLSGLALPAPVEAQKPEAVQSGAAAGTLSAPDLDAAMQAFTAGMEAKERKEFAQYRAGIERAVELLPDPSRLLYRLAVARLLAGDTPGAIAAYRRQVDSGLARDPRQDPDLAALLPEPAFKEALVRLDALAAPVVASTVAFEVPVRDLIEGIAYDPKTGSFFFSSVAERKIVRRTKDGQVSDFVPTGAHGLM
ncbi:MAG: hypothetical protein ABIU84_01425, partial [Thermoanaerobaculia bacterium]